MDSLLVVFLAMKTLKNEATYIDSWWHYNSYSTIASFHPSDIENIIEVYRLSLKNINEFNDSYLMEIFQLFSEQDTIIKIKSKVVLIDEANK